MTSTLPIPAGPRGTAGPTFTLRLTPEQEGEIEGFLAAAVTTGQVIFAEVRRGQWPELPRPILIFGRLRQRAAKAIRKAIEAEDAELYGPAPVKLPAPAKEASSVPPSPASASEQIDHMPTAQTTGNLQQTSPALTRA